MPSAQIVRIDWDQQVNFDMNHSETDREPLDMRENSHCHISAALVCAIIAVVRIVCPKLRPREWSIRRVCTMNVSNFIPAIR